MMQNYSLDPESLASTASLFLTSQFPLFHIALYYFPSINHLHCSSSQYSKLCPFQLDARVADISRQP